MPRQVLMNPGIGFFGKLPSTGDFVSRGLAPGLRPFLDQWLTGGLAEHARTPEGWPTGGLRAILHQGERWLILLILPSVDKPGRRFPLAICRATSPAPSQQSAQIWCDSILNLATNAIADAMLADDLLLALTQIPEPELEPDANPLGDIIWSKTTDPIVIPAGGLPQSIAGLF